MKTRKKRYGVILSAIFAAFLFLGFGKAQAKPWVTAYYAGWELGDGTNGYLPVSDVDFSAMTDVVHFAIVPNTDGTLNTTDNDITTAGAAALTTAAHAVGTKVLISVGGWATESGFLGATSSANLNTFVSNLVAFIKNNNYDGIDIDWEPLNTSDETQYVALMQALRSALGTSYIITTTAGFDAAAAAAVVKYVNQINIMTYDMSGPWQGWISWYNSPVHQNGVTFPSTGGAVPAIDNNVQSYVSAGVPASMLGIGSEFAGAVWNGGVMSNGAGITGPEQSWSTAPTVQEDVPLYAANGSGIMQKYYNANNYHWDSGAQASYLSITGSSNSGDYFISYEDTNDVNAKFNYINQAGLGGLIIYSLGMGYPGNGTYPLLAVVKRDMGGGTTIIKDTTPPTVSITSPANGATISGSVSVTANATDNVGVTGVTFKVDGSLLGSVLSVAPFSTTLNTLTLTNGSHTITATATDAAGNSSTASESVTVSNVVASKDTIPPTVSLTSPSNGSTVSGTISLTASASDNVGVTGVQFKIDGANLGSAVTTSPYTVSWTSSGVSNGSHTISAVASDAAGNTATSSVTVNVSNSSSQVAANDLWIYQNKLAAGWSDGSWGLAASSSFNSNQTVYPGCTKSIKVVQDPSGGLRFLSGGWNALVPVDPSPYTSVTFEIYSTYSLQLQVFLMGGPSGVTFPTVNYGSIANGQWTQVTVPFSSLDPGNQTFTMLVIDDASGNTVGYYIDNVKLSGFPVPTLASPANAATGVALPVSLSWNALASGTSCRVQVSTNQSFSSTVFDTTVSSGSSVTPGNLQAGTTYYWRADASSSGLTSQWSSVWSFTTASGTAPVSGSVAGLVIYGDALASPWMDASWNATLNYSNTTPVDSGSYSISVAQGQWGGASFHYNGWNSGLYIDPTQYGSVQFAVYAASSMSFNVELESDAGTSFQQVSAGSVPANQWTVLTVPMSSLNPSSQQFDRIDIMETSGQAVTYYLDNIQLNNVAGTKVASGLDSTSSIGLPTSLVLGQNYPNPFNPTTNIMFSLPKDAHVTLKVYNALGQEVTTLVDDDMSAGVHSVVWDGSRFASGVYFYRIETGNKSIIKKMLLVK